MGLGFSEIQGLIYSMSIQQDNFLGSGKRLGLGISYSSIISSLNITYDNPYWTDDGVSRGFGAFFRDTDADEANIADYSTDTYGVDVSYGLYGGATKLRIPNVASDRVNIRRNAEHIATLLAEAGLAMGDPRGITWRPGKGLHLSDDLSLNYAFIAWKS